MGGDNMNLLIKRKLKAGLYHTFVIAFAFVMMYPILWMIASSLKPESEIFQQAASLIPSSIHWKLF